MHLRRGLTNDYVVKVLAKIKELLSSERIASLSPVPCSLGIYGYRVQRHFPFRLANCSPQFVDNSLSVTVFLWGSSDARMVWGPAVCEIP